MVAGPLGPARLDVDRARRARRGQRGRDQDVVDAQPPLLLEGEHAVVPPRVRALGLLEQPERVGQSQRDEAAERLLLGLAEQHLPGPLLRVVHVAILGRDVVVAEEHELRVARDLLARATP